MSLPVGGILPEHMKQLKHPEQLKHLKCHQRDGLMAFLT